MQTLTYPQLINLIDSRPGTKIATITTRTEHKLKKSWQGGKVYKISRVNGILGYNYENSVNNQLIREGKDTEFQAESRKWGTRISPNFVEHKENHYLTIKVENTIPPTYIDENNQVIDKASFQDHEYAKSNSSRQGTDKQVIHRDYSLNSILSVRMNGNDYTLVHIPNK